MDQANNSTIYSSFIDMLLRKASAYDERSCHPESGVKRSPC